jgi:RNA polymerase sigma factor (sigma-70 family)
MSEQDLVALVKSFLRSRRASPTIEERLAWEEFFHVYDAVIRVSIARAHRAVHVIDDVTQDVWIIVIRRLPKWVFDPALGAIGAWVAKIASRLAARRARRHSRPQPGSLGASNAETLADPEPGPDAEFERMQEHQLFGELVSEFAASLDERDGRIVVMHWVQAFPLSRIASDLNMSEDAVWWVIRRVKPNLLDYLRRSVLGHL